MCVSVGVERAICPDASPVVDTKRQVKACSRFALRSHPPSTLSRTTPHHSLPLGDAAPNTITPSRLSHPHTRQPSSSIVDVASYLAAHRL
eukprot:2784882-Pleurochrysis_carterae.AAC.1